MAIDEALLRHVTAPVLRFYRWSEPDAVSIGYFDPHSCVPNGRPFVRRYTGGGLVDHQSDFTYSIIISKLHPLTLSGTTGSYQSIHEAVTLALRHQGFTAELAPCCLEAQSSACFEKPVKFDVISGASKLAGGAQRRTREGCLHQGSILIKNFDYASLKNSLTHFLTPLLADVPEDSALTELEKTSAEKLAAEKYQTPEWNLSK